MYCAGRWEHDLPLQDVKQWQVERLLDLAIRDVTLYRAALTSPSALPAVRCALTSHGRCDTPLKGWQADLVLDAASMRPLAPLVLLAVLGNRPTCCAARHTPGIDAVLAGNIRVQRPGSAQEPWNGGGTGAAGAPRLPAHGVPGGRGAQPGVAPPAHEALPHRQRGAPSLLQPPPHRPTAHLKWI